MEPEGLAVDAMAPDTRERRAAPRASQWFWRPWYAKLWWVLVALYWTGKLGSFWITFLADLYSTVIAGWLNILFYPLTVLLVLGVGFARAWMEYRGLEFGPPTDDQLFPKRSVGGWRDPYSDPLDPRSGSLWLGSPENQAKLFKRHWP